MNRKTTSAGRLATGLIMKWIGASIVGLIVSVFLFSAPALMESAAVTTFTISGNVKADGANLSGAAVSLTGTASGSTTTDASGNYSFTNLTAGGNYTVSVYKNGIVFTPATQSFTNLQADQTANFQNGVPLCAPPSPGLVAWYRAEHTFTDSSGFANYGTPTGGINFLPGKVGKGFIFDGDSDWMSVPDNANLKPSTLTVGGWFRFTNVPGAGSYYRLASKYGGDNRGWILRYYGDQTVGFGVYNTSPNSETAVSSETVPTNTWAHIAGTYDGTTIRIYVNGVLSASSTFNGGYTPSTIPMQIGKASWINGEFTNGNIDEFQVYNRALSNSEVAAISNSGSTGLCAQHHLPAANGKIVFDTDRDGKNQIYTMNSDGTNLNRLTNNLAFLDYQPEYSADGSQIVFSRYYSTVNAYDIYKMNADGSNPVNLTNGTGTNASPSFSPDGSKIVYHSFQSGNYDIWVMNADGSNKVKMTTNPTGDWYPTWSPDGSKIAFRSNRDGNWEIYIMNADSSFQTRLTNTPTDEDDAPAFSPDGTKLVFTSMRDGNNEVYVMNADGLNQTRLTSNTFSDHTPAFSADGTKILFASNRDGNEELYVMNADGNNQNRLTTNAASDQNPNWQPVRFQTLTPIGVPGSLDASFGGTGKIVTPVGSSHDYAHSVAIQADGRIVAARLQPRRNQ